MHFDCDLYLYAIISIKKGAVSASKKSGDILPPTLPAIVKRSDCFSYWGM